MENNLGKKDESAFKRWFVEQDYDFKQSGSHKSPIGEWFENPEYSRPVKTVSLPSLWSMITAGSKSLGRILARRSQAKT